MPPHSQYRESDKRHLLKASNGCPPVPEPYRLSLISGIARRSSDLFFITFFKRDPGEPRVVEAMGSVFGVSLLRVVRVGAWFYEVQLVGMRPWGEIQVLVSEALGGLAD